MDAMTRSFGPHTSYLPPEEKEDFDINMKGQLEGIGAVLREDDGYIKVVRIIPGSASWRQGQLKAEDIILKVAKTEKDEAISIVETPVREAVKLIRGPKGSTVVLTIKKPDGIIKNIPIQRDIVVIKSAYAKFGIFKAITKILATSIYHRFIETLKTIKIEMQRMILKMHLKHLTNPTQTA